MEIVSDNPIKNSASDLLDRARGAELFSQHLFSLDYKEGLVVCSDQLIQQFPIGCFC